MNGISVGELKSILENYPDDYEIVMSIEQKYPTFSDIRCWRAYINGVKADDDFQEIILMN